MSDLNIQCQNPDCGSENAYHNGIEFECPDCDYTWGGIEEDDTDGFINDDD
jgi:uncharacterized Zn ribbon protein